MTINSRYVDIDFSLLENGTYILDAHLGAGKTTSTKSLRYEDFIYITFRNSLIDQYASKKFIADMVAHRNSQKEYLRPHQLRNLSQLAINYSSLKKLSQEERTEHRVAIIDEPFGIWKDSTTYKPDPDNEAEFKHILRTTPIVIYMGGDFPEFLTKEIKEIASSRTKELGQSVETFKYHYPTDKGINVDFVYGKQGIDDKNMLIKMQMDLMQKKKELEKESEDKEDDFIIIDSSNEDSIADELNRRSDEREKNRITNNKGVLITTEMGVGVKAIAKRWQDLYPDLNILHYYSENANNFPEEFKTNLSDPEHYSDIDMLITSPSLSTGFDINNEFDLIIGDYVSNQGMPLHPREIFQALHRERNPKHIVIQLRLGFPPDTNPTIPPWPTKTDFKTINKWKESCKELGFPIDNWNATKRATDGSIVIKNEYREIYERAVEVVKDNVISRQIRAIELWKMFKKSGATVRNWQDFLKEISEEQAKVFDYSNVPNFELTHLNERLTGELQHTKKSLIILNNAIRCLDLPKGTEVLTEEQCKIFDFGNYEQNFHRRYDLTQSDEPHSQGISLVKRILNITTMINKITEESYLSPEMLFRSKDLDWIKENRDRLEKIINSYMNQSIPLLSRADDPKTLEWLEEILRKHFYLVEIKSGGVKTGLEAKAKKEVGSKLLKWKKEYKAKNNVEGYLKIYDYLFIGLTDKTLQWSDLGKDTKAYLKSFPHLTIRENKEDYHKLENLHY